MNGFAYWFKAILVNRSVQQTKGQLPSNSALCCRKIHTERKNELLFVSKAVKPSYGWYPCP